MNALAFVFDGLYYGVSDFGYAAYSMVSFCPTILMHSSSISSTILIFIDYL